MSDTPRRAYVLELKLEADSRNDLIGTLRNVEYLIASNQLTKGVSGGVGSGYIYDLDIDESITHDSYMAAIDAWLEDRKVTPHVLPD